MILVTMQATFITDGNWDEERRRKVNERMDSEKILNASNLNEAIEYFKSKATYVDEIKNFEYFEIQGKKYKSTYWDK